MATSVLNLHSGGHLVSYEELKAVHTPQPSGRWHPVAHSVVIDRVSETLTGAGYEIKSSKLAIAREGKRFFGTLDLGTPLSDGVALAVGIRNSTDKSFPLAFAAGSRVFVCSNLSFTAELLVKRKHTSRAVGRWNNEIAAAVQKLPSFAESETHRIAALKQFYLTDDQALALFVRAMEKGIIAAPVIPKLVTEWRNPTHDYGTGTEPTAWRAMNTFTTVLGKKAVSNPTEYAGQTIRLNALLALPEAKADVTPQTAA